MAPGCLGSPPIELRGLSKVHNIFEIIQLYRANQCLWNPCCKDFYDAAEIKNAWSRITRLMRGLFTTDEIKNVIHNLREYFEDECELLEMKKQQGIKRAQPRHIYYYSLQFLNTIDKNAYESDDNDNRKLNIDSDKNSNSKRRRHVANISGRKRSHRESKTIEKQPSFLCESLSEYRIKQPVPLMCRIHQGSSKSTKNTKQNLYSGMRHPEENSSKTQPVSMFLDSTVVGKPVLKTGPENLSFIPDRIDTKKKGVGFVNDKNNNQVQFKQFRIYENEIYPNIFQEVKVPDTSLSFPHLNEQKFNHPVAQVSRYKSKKLNIKLLLLDATTGKISKLQDLHEAHGDFTKKTLPLPKLSSNRTPRSIVFSNQNNLAHQRVSSGECSLIPEQSKYSLKSSSRKFNLLKSVSKSVQNCLTKSNTLLAHQLLPHNSLSVQLLDSKSNASQVEVAQQVYTYAEPEKDNVIIVDLF